MSFIVYFLLFIASTVSSQEEPPLPAGLGEEITPDTGEPELPMGLEDKVAPEEPALPEGLGSRTAGREKNSG